MERNSYNGDFERFLRDSANSYRMYPSEKVWNGVHRSLHKRSKWYRFSALLLLFSFLTTGLVFIFSLKKSDTPEVTAQSVPSQPTAQKKSAPRTPETQTAAVVRPKTHDLFQQPDFVAQTPTVHPMAALALANPTRIASESNDLLATNDLTTSSQNIPAEESFLSEPSATARTIQPAWAMGLQKAGRPETDRLTAISDRSVTNPALPFTRPARKKMSWQLHFTPTVSYRKLSENKEYRPVGSINYTSLLNVNEAVNHKPDIGFEIGLDARYALSERLRARIGIQSNVTRYEIRAYSSRTELATITLNSANGTPNNMSAISNYRNFGGYRSNWLENLYLQVSIPLGIDYIIADNKKTQFGISSSVQPTYLLGKKAYLLSADYKNYVKVPELIRRWNANVDFETFVSYSTGRIQWQVGPQVRYQVFSSFVGSYPVKENLFDFGLKLGMSLNK